MKIDDVRKPADLVKRALCTLTVCFIVIYPFLAYCHIEQPTGLSLIYFAKKSRFIADYFYYIKEWGLVVFSIALLAGILTYLFLPGVKEQILSGRTKVRLLFSILAGYAGLCLLSCIFSEHREIALWGLCKEYEGILAMGGYLLLFLGGYMLFSEKQGRGYLKAGIFILGILTGICSVAEWIWGSPFENEEFVRLLTPDRYGHVARAFMDSFQNKAVLAFGNPGYLGGFCALLLPAALGIFWEARGKSGKVLGFLSSAGFLAGLVLSGATGPLYGAIFSIIILCLLSKSLGFLFSVGFLCISVFLAVFGAGAAGGITGISKMLKGTAVNESYTAGDSLYYVDKIQLDEGILKVDSKDSGFSLEYHPDREESPDIASWFTARDENGKELTIAAEGSMLALDGEEYQYVKLGVMDQLLEVDLGYEDPVVFYLDQNGLFYNSFNGQPLAQIPQPAIEGMDKFYSLFTGRGYAWVSILPVLKECIVLGKGVGTFPFYFPQSEVAGMLNTHGSCDLFVEKAHNWYIQTAAATGILSLICLLALCIYHIAKKVRQIRSGGNWGTGYENGIFCGVLAYQVTGIVNDSSITVSPFFWLLFGCSFGILFKCGREGLQNNKTVNTTKKH